VAWALYPGSVWATGFYGSWIAVGVIAAWVAAVLLFMPRNVKDRAAAWVRAPRPQPLRTPRRGPTEEAAAEKDPIHAPRRVTSSSGRGAACT
jgi:hypothetical protein